MKTVLIEAYEGAVLFTNVPNCKGKNHLINLAIYALNERPGGRYLWSLSNVEYIPNPVLFKDYNDMAYYRSECSKKYYDKFRVTPELVIDYQEFRVLENNQLNL